MDIGLFLSAVLNAIGTMIIVVMFVTGPMSLAVEYATRLITRE